MILMDTEDAQGAKIRVVGVGGGGGNAVNSMISRNLIGVDFISINTDAQALAHNNAGTKIQIGPGLGAGGNPEVARRFAEETADEIRTALMGSDMVFVTAGMGGGTGTGASPLVAKIGRELGALVVGIITRPFEWEAKVRSRSADGGIDALRSNVDALIVIPNQRLLSIIDNKTPFKVAFQMVDDVLYNATRGISDIISGYGYINVDFADVRAIMKDTGDALMGIGIASGENRALEAATNALNSPLLEGISIKGAQGLLINISAGEDVTMYDVSEAVQVIEGAAGSDVNLIHGVSFNPDMGDKLMVTVVATGFKHNTISQRATTASIPQMPQPTFHTPVQEVMQTPPSNQPTAQFSAAVTPQVTIQQPIAATPAPIQPTVTQQQQQSTPPNVVQADFARQTVAATTPQQRAFPDAKPSGLDRLRQYDAPAATRRNNGSIPIANVSREQQTVQPVSLIRETTVIATPPASERPAFLRKIMD
ncbi:MAG: cell division protein FtsZ [Ignavibacteria bacterium]|nr:cell division protein FtsZ [Ignavibacteria bacterium]